tara:strand:- start:36762 stop:37754 length:993 start_codon:yes stop_codon:yes gene_type:complete
MTVFFIGNAILDVISKIDQSNKINPSHFGKMNLINHKEVAKQYNQLGEKKIIAGGSANNTAASLSMLGEEVGFIGKIGIDDYGEMYQGILEEYSIKTTNIVKDKFLGTGMSIILVSPSGERTMSTYLGASICLKKEEIPSKLFNEVEGLFIEAYLYYLPEGAEIVRDSFHKTKKSGGFNCLSLSDVNCVEKYRNELEDLIDNKKIDYLFGNMNEMLALTKTKNPSDMLKKLSDHRKKVKAIIITDGSNGSILVSKLDIEYVKAVTTKDIIDTTGAGDIYVAGFLKGLLNGLELNKCCYLGSVYASEIIQVMGGKFDKQYQSKLKNSLDLS